MLDDLRKIDLRELSSMYDEESRDVFVSLYLNVENMDKNFVDKRIKECNAVLKDEILRENFNKTMEWIDDYLKEGREGGQKGLIIFASYIKNIFIDYKLAIPLKNMIVVDSSPYIKPIAELMDEYVEYGLVLLNNNRARIYSIYGTRIENEKRVAEHVINKHKKGGWSQARFQRIRKEEIKHFLKKVAEDMERLKEARYIVLAGPGEAKKWLMDYLSNDIKNKVITTIDVDMEAKPLGLAREKIEEERGEEIEEELHSLMNEILKNGLAIGGIGNTIKSLKNGEVDLLFIKKGLKIKGWKCEKCQAFGVGEQKKCPYCGGKTTEVDVIEEMVEEAEKMDTKVEFTDNEMISKLGGAAGFLRYKS